MKLRLSALIVLLFLLIPIHSRADVNILPSEPKITDIEFSKPDFCLFKTKDTLNCTIKTTDYNYDENDRIRFHYNGDRVIDYIENNPLATFVEIPNNSYFYDEDTKQFNILLPLTDEGKIKITYITISNDDTNLSMGYSIWNDKYRYVDGYTAIVNNKCSANNHTIKADTPFETITQPTCTEPGSQGKRCIICNQIIDETIEEIPALGHTPSEDYITIKHATCVDKGSKAKKCTVCGAVLEETIQETPIDPHWHVGGVEKVIYNETETTIEYTNKCKSCGKIFDPLNNPNEWMDNKKDHFPVYSMDLKTTKTEALSPIQQDIPSIQAQDTQTTTPQTPTLKYIKNNNKKTIIVTWNIIDDVKGYEVQYALNKKFTKSKKSKTVTKSILTVKKLKKGKTYYVRVRGYNVGSDGKKIYGEWSSVKKVKVKK